MNAVVLIAALFAGDPGEGQGKATWLKLDQGKCVSSRTGRPILAYVACDPTTGRLV